MNKNELKPPSSELLHTFCVIAECQNLTRAATKLNRTQSAVSVQLRKLEESIGVSLFERRSNGMTITDDGRKLLPLANRTLAELQRIPALFQSRLSGHISIGIPDDFNDISLEQSLAEFKIRHPSVKVDARSGCTSSYAQAVQAGDLDIAICSGPEKTDGEFLSSEATVWACKTGSNLSFEEPIALAILDRQCWWRDLATTALDKAEISWKVSYKSESFFCVRSAIQAGFAIGVLPVGSVQPGMQILTKTDGFPNLPPAQRVLLRGNRVSEALMNSMSDAIRHSMSAL